MSKLLFQYPFVPKKSRHKIRKKKKKSKAKRKKKKKKKKRRNKDNVKEQSTSSSSSTEDNDFTNNDSNGNTIGRNCKPFQGTSIAQVAHAQIKRQKPAMVPMTREMWEKQRKQLVFFFSLFILL